MLIRPTCLTCRKWLEHTLDHWACTQGLADLALGVPSFDRVCIRDVYTDYIVEMQCVSEGCHGATLAHVFSDAVREE